jgi:alginate O-acetyltransferase complex protein AlgI
MSFTSGEYFLFLIVVFFGYWLTAERRRGRTALLLAANYLFYLHAGVVPLLTLFAVSTIGFCVGLRLPTAAVWRRRALLGVSVAAPLGALCVFKYANFFIGSSAAGLSVLGLALPETALAVVVPLGISFFTFQSIAYVVDVYRKDAEPTSSYLDYLAFVSFFPTIVAGPILRARQLLPRLGERTELDPDTGARALLLIAVGLVKKIAVADYLSANFVDRVFDFPARFSSLEVLVAIYAYALQIYADFSGYSDIAIGSAMLLGFRLPANFNAPYRSRSLDEFWRRWHISLSTWLRDYVFFSLVGRRPRRTIVLYSALVATMLVGGLWHGPSWTFVFWGLMHGIGLVAVRAYGAFRRAWGTVANEGHLPSAWRATLGTVAVFHFVCLTWVFFRSESVTQALSVLHQVGSLTADASNLPLGVLVVIGAGYLAHWVPDRAFETAVRAFASLPSPAQAGVLLAIGLGLYHVASSDVVPFIYARF